ncbi:MAG: preprotein translocase subunit SecY [Parcubacteria group bacterium CG11_big_fil_rev_8_21_14_0_20_39_22]|nr:MAG: preprotein translocase subunit SecY [Parcubacteria group bacterium CG11_big_fil_rev_8_21_14_0_20_39_22]
MFSSFFHKLKIALTDSSLRKKIGFVAFALILFRVLAAIPIPGVNVLRLEEFFSNNQFLGLLNIFSGGGLSNLSIVMLGVGPYITASIIMQLLTILSPKLKAMYHEEGEAGRRRFSQYSRFITVPLALLQGYGFMVLLGNQGILGDLTTFEMVTNLLVVVAGSLLLMWIGELISEFGIGNGVSLIIFAGIVASIPTAASQIWFARDISQVPLYLGFLVAAFLIILGVVTITEAERPIPVTYAKRVRGMKVYGGISTYLPLRLNQAGVIPIIFALSILLFPQMILNFLVNVDSSIVQAISGITLALLSNSWFYSSVYFILVFLFTFFYTAVTFDPDSIATNLQKNGAFIPGVRPGQTTSQYVAKVLTRITLVGALFLGLIAVLPLVMQGITGNTALAIGGTALLIVVSVVLDLVKKIEAQVSMREY